MSSEGAPPGAIKGSCPQAAVSNVPSHVNNFIAVWSPSGSYNFMDSRKWMFVATS